MPTKTWVVGEEVLAADFNTYVQEQVVATFSTTAARDAAITTPKAGMMCWAAGVRCTYNGTVWIGEQFGTNTQTTNPGGGVGQTFPVPFKAKPVYIQVSIMTPSGGQNHLFAAYNAATDANAIQFICYELPTNRVTASFPIEYFWTARGSI
jgi:streptogramin lyase